MTLEEEFRVAAPIEEVWTLLLDPGRVAPCLPGVTVTGASADGRSHAGTMRVRVGPVAASFEGTLALEERDDVAHRATFRAEGRDRAGEVSARVSLAVSAIDAARVAVRSSVDLSVTGRLGQFGRAVIQDVARRMFSQFASNVAALLEKGQPPEAGALAAMPSVLKGAVRVIRGR